MFLRHNKRTKLGKKYRYWSVVENRRISPKRTAQKTLLYLGELNDSDRASWTRSVEAVDEQQKPCQINLFPHDRTPDPALQNPAIQLWLGCLQLSQPRKWGDCWLALQLWDRLQLDEFWRPHLGNSRHGTHLLKVLKSLVIHRLLAPAGESDQHRPWFDQSAMAELLADNFRLTNEDTLRRCGDHLLEHKSALFSFLQDRWCKVPESRCQIVLYDLTDFGGDGNEPVAEDGGHKALGDIRDKRPASLHLVLLITPDGRPVAYEIMRGDASDKSTVHGVLEEITRRHGKDRRIWIMNRGVPTAGALQEMRAAAPGVSYLVGTPKDHLTKLEKQLAAHDWEQVQNEITVKLLPQGDELYVLARSLPHRAKERTIRRKKLKTYWKRLGELKRRKSITRHDLLLAIEAAQRNAGSAATRLVDIELPPATATQKSQRVGSNSLRFALNRKKLKSTRLREGQHLLRSNLTGEDPAVLAKTYRNLVRIEESFRTLKSGSDLGDHQDDPVEARIFISFLAYCLHTALEKDNKRTGLSARSILDRFSEIRMLDLNVPSTDGREVRMNRHTRPERSHQLLLDQLGLVLPAQSPLEIHVPEAPARN